jgi:uncharacterized membrane protein YeaQ/YmgE (transglycosylase-associated protein family)
MVIDWIAFALFGLVLGILAHLVRPRPDPRALYRSAAIGVAGALLGAAIGRALGIYGPGSIAGGLVASVLGAVIPLVVWAAISERRRAGYA